MCPSVPRVRALHEAATREHLVSAAFPLRGTRTDGPCAPPKAHRRCGSEDQPNSERPTKRVGDASGRLPGHRESVVIVEARRLVGIGARPDVAETPSERCCGRVVFSGRAARVPVMRAAEARLREDLPQLRRFNLPVIRSVFREGEMDAILVVPGLELSEEPSRMSFT